MKVSLYYLHLLELAPEVSGEIKTKTDFENAAWRFRLTYERFPALADHELVIVFLRGNPTNADRLIWAGLPCRFEHYQPQGRDGWGAQALQEQSMKADCDLMVVCDSRNYFHRVGWLRRIVESWQQHGDGFYGAMVGYDGCPLQTHPAPNPHIRGTMNAWEPKTFNQYPHKVKSREDCYRLECGEWNISQWYMSQGKPAVMVTWDGAWLPPQWKVPKNIYRRGDQSNLIVCDRHSDFYAMSDKPTQQRWELQTYGYIQ